VVFLREQFQITRLYLLAMIAECRRMGVHPGNDLIREEVPQL
jgi:hypothetical protein